MAIRQSRQPRACDCERLMIEFVYDDGGRAAAGYRGHTGDCVCRAIAIATQRPYQQVYDDLNSLGARERKSAKRRGKSSARTGVYKPTIRRYLASLGWQWHSTMGIGTGTRVHLRADELPAGRIIVQLSKHNAAVIDGVLHDLFDCSREGTRAVYGYWSKD